MLLPTKRLLKSEQFSEIFVRLDVNKKLKWSRKSTRMKLKTHSEKFNWSLKIKSANEPNESNEFLPPTYIFNLDSVLLEQRFDKEIDLQDKLKLN